MHSQQEAQEAEEEATSALLQLRTNVSARQGAAAAAPVAAYVSSTPAAYCPAGGYAQSRQTGPISGQNCRLHFGGTLLHTYSMALALPFESAVTSNQSLLSVPINTPSGPPPEGSS